MTPYEDWSGTKAYMGSVYTYSCMAVCLVPKLKRDHKPSPTGEWLLFLGMSEDHKVGLLINPSIGKEAQVKSSAFHEYKWQNIWRRERKQTLTPLKSHL